jgi:hypothetical protein
MFPSPKKQNKTNSNNNSSTNKKRKEKKKIVHKKFPQENWLALASFFSTLARSSLSDRRKCLLF